MGSFENLTAFLVPHSHCDLSFVALALDLIGSEGHHQSNININFVFHGQIFPGLVKNKNEGIGSIFSGKEIDLKCKPNMKCE